MKPCSLSLLCLILVLSVSEAYSQSSDTVLASIFMEKADGFRESSRVDSAGWYYEKAVAAWEKALTNGEYEDEQRKGMITFYAGDCHFQLGNNSEALSYFFSSAELLEKSSGPYSGHSFHQIAQVYLRTREYEKAIEFANKAQPLLEGIQPLDTQRLTENWVVIATSNFRLGQYPQALSYYLKAYDLHLEYQEEASTSPYRIKLATNLYNIGIIYSRMANYQTALEYLFQSMEIARAENNSLLPACLTVIGTTYGQLGDYRKALTFLEEAYQQDLIMSPESHVYIGGDLVNIGIQYSRVGEHQTALNYFFQAIEILKHYQHPFLANCYLNIGVVYIELEEYQKALEYFDIVLDLEKEMYNFPHPALGFTNFDIGDAYLELGDFQKALEYFFLAEANWEATGDISLLHALNAIGTTYAKLGDHKQALTYLNRSFRVNLADFHSTDIYSLPSFSPKAYNDLFYLDALKLTGNSFLQLAQEDGAFLLKADSSFLLAIQLLDHIRESVRNEDSKLILLDRNKELFESGIATSLGIYKQTGKEAYLSQAFLILEKSKAAILSEAINSGKARQFAALPAEVLDTESRIRYQLNFLEENLFELERNGSLADSTEIKEIRSQMLFVQQSYDSLLAAMEKGHPAYYQLKYGSDVATTGMVQQALRENEAMISYFMGDTVLYAFALSQDRIAYMKYPREADLDSMIFSVRQGITQRNSDPESFLIHAHGLYKILLQPFSELIHGKQLTIIPDGLLSYVPFEVLLAKPVETTTFPASLPYLLKEHQIGYGYSASLQYQEKTQVSNPSPQYLAFAPEFNSRGQQTADDPYEGKLTTRGVNVRGDLAPLFGTQREINLLSQYLSGRSFSDAEATEQQFKALAGEFGILHLATHAIIDDEYPMDSRLLFSLSDDSTEDGDLHAWELYNLSLDAQLVVLSACNTGFGKLQGGEGVMSLGRAFAYAGVPSMVVSLWPAEDESTADLMGEFYQGLANGLSKDQALRNAKLHFLSTAPPNAKHPFFWAGFVVQGDPDPITNGNWGGWWLLLIGGIVIVGGILGWRWRSHRLSQI